jgi:uncharacterized protein YdiU (UPF0061 family)
MHWNMACLASAMLPLIELDHSAEDAQALLRSALEDFPVEYASQWQDLFRHKLGLFTAQDGDIELIERLLQAMHDSRIDFTSFFRSLSDIRKSMSPKDIALRNDFLDRDGIDGWFQDYLARLQKIGYGSCQSKIYTQKSSSPSRYRKSARRRLLRGD